jgi:anti-sigma factor RsiW
VTCEGCVDFLLDYIDGVLPESERFKFESHIAFCKDCEVYLDNYKKAAAAAASAGKHDRSRGAAEVPEALIQAILRTRKHEH